MAKYKYTTCRETANDGGVDMLQVIFYTKDDCPLCDEAEALFLIQESDYNVAVEKRDIHTNDERRDRYELQILVIDINGKQLPCEVISYHSLEQLIKETVTTSS